MKRDFCARFFTQTISITKIKVGGEYSTKHSRVQHSLKICKNPFVWRHNGYFGVISMRHSHSFNYYAIFFKLTHFVPLFFVLFGITNWQFWLLSLSIMASEKNNGNPLKLRHLQILKQNVDSDWFWVADNEYDHIKVTQCVFSR